MKKFVSKQKNCLYSLVGLILVSELLLKINNKIIQSIGIILIPLIISLAYFLIKSDNKKTY